MDYKSVKKGILTSAVTRWALRSSNSSAASMSSSASPKTVDTGTVWLAENGPYRARRLTGRPCTLPPPGTVNLQNCKKLC